MLYTLEWNIFEGEIICNFLVYIQSQKFLRFLGSMPVLVQIFSTDVLANIIQGKNIPFYSRTMMLSTSYTHHEGYMWKREQETAGY